MMSRTGDLVLLVIGLVLVLAAIGTGLWWTAGLGVVLGVAAFARGAARAKIRAQTHNVP